MSTKLSLTGLLLVNLLASVAFDCSTGAQEPGALHDGVPDVAKGLPDSKPDSAPGSRPQGPAQRTITVEGKGLPPEVKDAQEDEDKLWEAFRKSQQEASESFEKAGLAAVSNRKLVGLTRKEVEAKLGKPSSADWFVHVTKPRFMGDRVRYTRDGPKADQYLSLGLFFKNGKVYACYFGVFDRVTGKAVEKYHQESLGKPIRLTIN
jgi:hypothetical protein